MYIIKKVEVKSFARIYALIVSLTFLIPWLIIGIFFGIVIGLLPGIGSFFGYYSWHSLSFFELGPIFFWLLIPFLIYLVALIAGLVIAWIYNLIADRVGGLKVNIELEPAKEP